MSRQIGIAFQSPELAVLEGRINRLEKQISMLTDAVRALTRAVEGGRPPQGGAAQP
ncbi:hypothetical protein Misp01_44550 [Microtetraspora sp. NBRC 13810]|uniref:hypothetical protein n=1 Tax=Microtetraspora sp. NBRC 13810 TaxID=3030990 RepID=UPI0024A0B806|nr:hypothetical protein [Microtetraspora sp. NBRC 13810]GLW09326.1 hypothetical protein Misp01_44550 [Microtetraspora sp. NBRC 13810]